MSSVEKLLVQGIRSFSPENPVYIHFYKPVTVIVGSNGAGKTSIIECLRYAASNDLPPISKSSFVHDPKVAGEPDVKAQVRLQFTSVTGDIYTAIRTLKATQKARKIEQRSLDSALEKLSKDGAPSTNLTTRCADMDRMMIQLLGVSKAVLANVIFCHQEDSNWPLSEGKALKLRFDEIFAATRYIKALDAIKTAKKNQDAKVKEYNTELMYLKQAKDKAKDIEEEMKKTQGKVVASQDRVTKIGQDLQPVEAKLEELGGTMSEFFEREKEIESMNAQRLQLEKDRDELHHSIGTIYEDSLEGLQTKHRELNVELQRDREQQKRYTDRLQSLEEESRRLTAERNKLFQDHGRLQQEYQAHKQAEQERDQEIRRLANHIGAEGVPAQGELSNTVVKRFLESMDEKVTHLREQLRSAKEETQQKEGEYQTRINQLRHSLASQEGTEKMKRKLLAENQQKLRQISADLRTIEASSSKLQNIEQDLRTAERDLEQARQDDKSADSSVQIDQLKREKRETDDQSRRLSDELQAINMQASARGAMEALRKERNVKEEAIKEIESRRGEEFQRLCRQSSEMGDNLLFLQRQIRQKQGALKRTSDRVKQTANDLTSKKTEIRMRQNECSEKEKQIKKLEDSIRTACPDVSVQAALAKIEDDIKEREESIEIVGQAEKLFKKYQSRLAETHQCPLCERDIGDKLQWLADKMNKAITKAPGSRSAGKKDLQDLKGKRETMLSALRSEETMASLRTEVSEIKQKLGGIQRVVVDLTGLEEELRDEEASLVAEETALRELEPDLRLLKQQKKELSEVQEKVRRQEAKISGGTSRTAQAVSAELQECQMKSEQISQQIESKQTWIVKWQQTITQLERQVNDHRSEKLQLEAKLQQRSRLVEQKTELTTGNERLELEVQECNRNLRPLQANLRETEKEKVQSMASRREAEEMMRAQADRLEQEMHSLQRKHKALLKYAEQGRHAALEQCNSQKREIEQRSQELDRQRSESSSNVQRLNKSIASHQLKEREIADNMRLQLMRLDVEKLQKQTEELRSKLGGLDYNGVLREEKRLQDERERFRAERAHAEGRLRQLNEQLQGFQRDLRADLYRDVVDRHRDKVIAVKTTEIAASDLEKYHRALDRAIMRFHAMKMKEINEIIKELWMKTYRGGDIDTIEIRSDDDTAPGGATALRRTYNYRVVMVKGTNELDMRGRCSAGQKVLASIIIRLALAETFCVNCGVIALDEPTSNLDLDNIESLANALSDLIKERRKQKNFQLIVITHDEAFLTMLSRSESVEYYYRVRKDESGCSKVFRHCLRNFNASDGGRRDGLSAIGRR